MIVNLYVFRKIKLKWVIIYLEYSDDPFIDECTEMCDGLIKFYRLYEYGRLATD
jgi:hypothetical protein